MGPVRISALVCLALCLLGEVSAAQDVQLRTWGVEEGLPLMTPGPPLATPDGYLWMAAHEGLTRFDGHSFVTFGVGDVGLQRKRFVQRGLTPWGTLWLFDDLGRVLVQKGERFVYLEYEGEPVVLKPDSLPLARGGWLWVLGQDALFRTKGEGVEWVASLPMLKGVGRGTLLEVTDEGVAYIGYGRGGEGKLWGVGPEGVEDLSFGHNAGRMLQGPEGVLWLSGADLYRLEEGGRPVAVRGPQGEPIPVCWMGVWGGAVYGRGESGWWKLGEKPERMEIETVGSCDPHPVVGHGHLFAVEGTTVYRDFVKWAEIPADPSAMWPMADGSLYFVNPKLGLGLLREPTVARLSAAEGLPGEGVYPLGLDHQEALWAGVWHHSVFRVDWAPGGKPLVERFEPTEPNKALFRSATFFGRDRRGGFLFQASARLFRRVEGDFEAVALPDELRFFQIRAFLEDGAGRLWVGQDKGLWMSTSGLEGAWQHMDLGESVPRKSRIYALLETGAGRFMVGTAGFGVLAGGEGGFERLGRGTTLETAHVRHLFEDRGGVVWAGTEEHGLCRIQADEVSCLSLEQGLAADGVHCVLEDGRGRLWTSHNKGISRLDRGQLDAVLDGGVEGVVPLTLQKQDGMRESECNGGYQSACVQDRHGRFVFATQKGLAFIDPEKVVAAKPAEPRLTRFRAVGRSVVLLPSQEAVAELVLSPQEREVEFGWTAPTHYKAEQLRFRYRLEGLDGSWRGPTANRKAHWNNLPPGRFALWVEVGQDGQWSGPVKLASVVREPAFTETAWFVLLLVGLGLAGVGLSVWQSTASLRRRRDELAELVRERTATIEERNSQLQTRTFELLEVNEALEDQKQMLTERSRQLTEQAQRLAELDEVKNRFVASVSHELRTPLTLIQGTVRDVLAQGEGLETSERARIEMAQRNAERLGELVDQLMEVARLEAGAVPLRVRRGDLSAFVRRVASRFEHAAQSRAIGLRVDAGERPVHVFFSEDMMDKVLTNLIGNALKFTPEGGSVVLALSRAGDPDDGWARVTVTDTGIGIEPEQRTKLFERFYQADSADNRAFEGIGLGLAIAREFVELHGGQIGVEGEQGSGSTFFFTLPLGVAHISPDEIDLKAEGGATAAVVAPEQSEDAGVVLVVEDHPDMRAYIAEHLRGRYRVLEAGDGQQALEIVAKHKPDLVVSDIMMPRMDGLEMSRRLRDDEETGEIPILLVSAKGGNQTRLESLALADDFLGKPFLMPELMSRVALLLKGGSGGRESVAEAGRTTGDTKGDTLLSLSDRATLSRLNEVVESRLGFDDFGVDALCEAMGLGRTVLYSTLQRLVGSTPAAHIRERRLQVAHERLLSGAHTTVSEVAWSVGMKPSYFARVYKSRFGVSPGQHLKK